MVLISIKIGIKIFFITSYLFIITIAQQIKEEKSTHGLKPLPIDPDIEADVIQNGVEDSIVKELSENENIFKTPDMDGKNGTQLEESQDDTIIPKGSPDEGKEDCSCNKDLTLEKVIEFLKKQFKQREDSERVMDENILKFLKYRLKKEDPIEIATNSALGSEKTVNLNEGSDLLSFDRSTDQQIADEIRELLVHEKEIVGDGLNPSKKSLSIDDLKDNDSFEFVENSVEQDKEAENIGENMRLQSYILKTEKNIGENRRLQSYILKAEKNLIAEKVKETPSTKVKEKENFINGKVEKKEFNELINSEEKEESKEELIRATEEAEDYEEVAQEEEEKTDGLEEDYSELNYNYVKKNEKGPKDEELKENENDDINVEKEKENNYNNLSINAAKEEEVNKHTADEKKEESGEKSAANEGPKKRRRKKYKGHYKRRKHHKKKTSNIDVMSEKENKEMTKEKTNAEDHAIIEVIGSLPSAMRITKNKEEVEEGDTEELVAERVVDWKEI